MQSFSFVVYFYITYTTFSGVCVYLKNEKTTQLNWEIHWRCIAHICNTAAEWSFYYLESVGIFEGVICIFKNGLELYWIMVAVACECFHNSMWKKRIEITYFNCASISRARSRSSCLILFSARFRGPHCLFIKLFYFYCFFSLHGFCVLSQFCSVCFFVHLIFCCCFAHCKRSIRIKFICWQKK